MKAGLFSVACVAIMQLATAQPHSTNTAPTTDLKQEADLQQSEPFWRPLTQRHHAKRAESSCAADANVATTIATATDTVTYEFEDVVVYVDDNNKPVSTTTIYRNLVSSTQTPAAPSTTAPPAQAETTAPAPSPSSQASPPAPPPSSSPAPAPASAPKQAEQPGAPVPQLSEAKAAAAPSTASSSQFPPGTGGSASSGPGFSSAISYTPYNADNSCKSTRQVATDLQQVTSYDVIRLYGTDCNQVANVIAATKGSVKLFLGIFDINSIQSEVQTISSAVNGNWGLINTVNIGNELVNAGTASAGQVTAAIGTARAALKTAGYNGPVVTVDTMVAMKNNPSLCTASDFCAINCHAFFDGNVLPAGAGDFVKNWAQQVSEAAGGKTTVVTESGWPTQGGTNNQAVPSQENHNTAISSLKSSFGGGTNLVLYGMYNDLWKKDGATTHGAEKYWGIYGNAPSA